MGFQIKTGSRKEHLNGTEKQQKPVQSNKREKDADGPFHWSMYFSANTSKHVKTRNSANLDSLASVR